MNDIGIGIFCFGKEIYHKWAMQIIEQGSKYNFDFYVLTDKPNLFNSKQLATIINYDKALKSYHDKILLVKHILKKNNISIILDADLKILNNNFFEILMNYEYEDGITYLETLEKHGWGKKYINDINMISKRWDIYNTFLSEHKIKYDKLETIWEYCVIFKNIKEDFYKYFEKLQLVKEYNDLISTHVDILGAGEGISLQLAATQSDTKCRRDNVLYESLKNNFEQTLNRI